MLKHKHIRMANTHTYGGWTSLTHPTESRTHTFITPLIAFNLYCVYVLLSRALLAIITFYNAYAHRHAQSTGCFWTFHFAFFALARLHSGNFRLLSIEKCLRWYVVLALIHARLTDSSRHLGMVAQQHRKHHYTHSIIDRRRQSTPSAFVRCRRTPIWCIHKKAAHKNMYHNIRRCKE